MSKLQTLETLPGWTWAGDSPVPQSTLLRLEGQRWTATLTVASKACGAMTTKGKARLHLPLRGTHSAYL